MVGGKASRRTSALARAGSGSAGIQMQAARDRALASVQREELASSAHSLVTSAMAARQRASASGPALGEAALGASLEAPRGLLALLAQPASARVRTRKAVEVTMPDLRLRACRIFMDAAFPLILLVVFPRTFRLVLASFEGACNVSAGIPPEPLPGSIPNPSPNPSLDPIQGRGAAAQILPRWNAIMSWSRGVSR